MNEAVIVGVMAALSPVMVVLITHLTRQGLDRKAEAAKTFTSRLEQQRADFMALIDPLQEDNKALRERLEKLENRTGNAERKASLVVRALRNTLNYLHSNYQDKGPDLDPAVMALLNDMEA